MIELRDFQVQAIDDLTTEAAQGKRRLLLVAPTGSGKTIIASKIIGHARSNGHKVLFLAHRRELVSQASEKLTRMGIDHGIMMSGEPYDPTHGVVVSSLQTLHAWTIRRQKESLPPADLVVFDECHHLFSSSTWQRIVESYPQSHVLGLTATPINRRGEGMQHCFDAMVKAPSISQLTNHGFLVPARYFVPSTPDLAKIRIQAGDYNEAQLAERMDQPKLIGDIVENWVRICPDRKTLGFATGIKHSIHLAEAFRSIGVRAAHIDGNTPSEERDRIVRDFKEGDLQQLWNCAVFTEGFDCPEATALVFARPTKSLGLYLQVAGRVLRPSQGKRDCVIVDHAGVYAEHGPVAQEWPWELEYGEKKTIGEMMRSRRENKRVDLTCSRCKMVFSGSLTCPNCGERISIKGRHMETWEAYLQELDADEQERKPILADRNTWCAMLLHYARARGKKDGFAWYKCQEKFGSAPRDWKRLTPIAPSVEVLSWIRSRNIAYAKARAGAVS